MALKVIILSLLPAFLTTFIQLTARLTNFIRGRSLILGLKVECVREKWGHTSLYESIDDIFQIIFFSSFFCNLSLNVLAVIRSGLHRIAAAVAYMSVQVATYFPSLSCLSHLIRFVSVNFALGQFACLDTIKEISDRIFSAAATPCYDRSRVNW